MQVSPDRSLSDARKMGHIPSACMTSPTSSASHPGNIFYRMIHSLIFPFVNPRTIARTLRPCSLVCRSWNELIRLYVEHAKHSWIHLALQGQTTISNEDHLYLSRFPDARALALEAFTHISLYSLLLKNPRPKSLRLLTHLRLSNRRCGHPLSIPSVGGLCGTIAASDTLQVFRLCGMIWKHPVGDTPVAPLQSRAQIHVLIIRVNRCWLLDPRSADFLTWLAHSGTVAKLLRLEVRHMMVLKEQLLSALLAVLNASRQRLVKLACSFGPERSLLPLLPTLLRCTRLRRLYIDLPCSRSAFVQLLKFVSNLSFPIKQLWAFSITLLRHPMCTEPENTMWGRLDDIFQTPPYLAMFIIASYTDLHTASRTVAWGDLYPFAYRDPVEGRRQIARLLPLTYQRRGLFHWDSPDKDLALIPAHVDRAFPVEICERIMDFVAAKGPFGSDAWAKGAHSVLVSGSLTCRAWRPRAQAHLFSAISVGGNEAKVSKLRILLTNNPALGPLVKTFTLYYDELSSASSLNVLPIGVARLLPSLEHLRIVHGVLWHVPPCASFGASIRRLSSLTKLSILRALLPSVEEVRQVICACRHLLQLSLERCTWKNPPIDTPGSDTAVLLNPISESRRRTSTRLKAITVHFELEWANDQRTCHILRWLAVSGALDSCVNTALWGLPICNNDTLAAVEAVVGAASESMKHLILNFGPRVELTKLSAALSLCQELEKLSIALPYDKATFSHFADLLHGSFVHANVHRDLYLGLELLYSPSLWTEPSDGQWQALDDIFQAAEERMFETIKITLRFPTNLSRLYSKLLGLDCKPFSTDWDSVQRRKDEFYTRLRDLLPQTFERYALYRENGVLVE